MIWQNHPCHTSFDDGADVPERMVPAAEAAGLGSVGISLHCPVSGLYAGGADRRQNERPV